MNDVVQTVSRSPVAGVGLTATLGACAVAFTLAGCRTRGASLARNTRIKLRSNLQTAIGIKHPRIVQKSEGFMGGSFNTREFFHGRAPSALRWVKWGFLVLAFPVPVALLAAGMALATTPLLTAAFAIQYVGLIAERWHFSPEPTIPRISTTRPYPQQHRVAASQLLRRKIRLIPAGKIGSLGPPPCLFNAFLIFGECS